MKPKKKKKSREKIFILDEAHGKGMSTAPSDTAFWLSWPEGDAAWAWINAVATADEKRDPGPMIQLLAKHVQEHAMPFVADLLNRKLTKAKRGPKSWLWAPSPLEAASIMVNNLRKKEDISVGGAVDQVLRKLPMFSLSLGVTRKKLIAHCTGKSGYGRKAKEKRGAIKMARSDPAP